jgi:hypothetical protein
MLLVFHGGTVRDQMLGVQPKKTIAARLDKVL